MDASDFKETKTRRRYTYAYYYKTPNLGKPTVLFLHGFPSTHLDWAPQITHFVRKGYGVIAPDLLGYGHTSAPDDADEYKMLDMVEDIIDILDDLKVNKVIGVGHDWGSILLSRLLNVHIDYVIGAAFLAVGYIPPEPTFNFKEQITTLNALLGYDVFGYMEFFSADDAVALTERNIDSFYSIFFPDDPTILKENFSPLGKVREWIEQDKQRPRAAFWTAEEQEAHKTALMRKGLRGPCCWYRARTSALNNAHDQSISQEAYSIHIPTFFGGATKDQVCLIGGAKKVMSEYCSNMTTKEFETSHWIMQEAPDELNEALDGFFATLQTECIRLK